MEKDSRAESRLSLAKNLHNINLHDSVVVLNVGIKQQLQIGKRHYRSCPIRIRSVFYVNGGFVATNWNSDHIEDILGISKYFIRLLTLGEPILCGKGCLSMVLVSLEQESLVAGLEGSLCFGRNRNWKDQPAEHMKQCLRVNMLIHILRYILNPI